MRVRDIDRAARAQVAFNRFRFTQLTETGGCNLEVLSKHLKKSPQALAGAAAKEPGDTGYGVWICHPDLLR
jgi:hypothetical protein